MLTNKQPTKKRASGWKTWCGNLSFFANYNGKKVKVYQPFNKEQLTFRLYIDQHPVSKYFPKVLGVENNKLIIEEFIYANDIVTTQAVKQFHEELLQVEYDRMTWDYFEHIYNRVGLIKPSINLSLKVNHNDLTKDNILCVDGQIKVIDNEMLAMNDAWEMNCINSNILTSSFHGQNESHWKVRKSWKPAGK